MHELFELLVRNRLGMVEVALADELLGLLLRTRERDEVLDGYVARKYTTTQHSVLVQPDGWVRGEREGYGGRNYCGSLSLHGTVPTVGTYGTVGTSTAVRAAPTVGTVGTVVPASTAVWTRSPL